MEGAGCLAGEGSAKRSFFPSIIGSPLIFAGCLIVPPITPRGAGWQVPDVVEGALRDAEVEEAGSISLQQFEALLRTSPDEALSLFQARLREQ